MKLCKSCSKEKPLSEFYTDHQAKDKLMYECKNCSNQRTRKYYQDNIDKKREIGRKYYHKDPLREKARRYSKNFGISLSELEEMFKEQNNCCKICKKHQKEFNKPLAVDHCHDTNLIRGLLCGRCNRGLGYFKDSPELLQSAMQYLEDSQKTEIKKFAKQTGKKRY